MLTHLFAYLTDPLSELVLKASRKFLPNARPVGMIMPKRRRSQSAERDSIQQNKQPRLDGPRINEKCVGPLVVPGRQCNFVFNSCESCRDALKYIGINSGSSYQLNFIKTRI
ncbi:uncharacterized protein LOC121599596 [Anopheles merus]|uniref:uncharacterized protein LOC121599596 n=1 Tax=Anopheles merus TaxID=30066 RepID=UPI001BE471B3|nr:uncharacterized protein LOC121599596 [Anopheles merus]